MNRHRNEYPKNSPQPEGEHDYKWMYSLKYDDHSDSRLPGITDKEQPGGLNAASSSPVVKEDLAIEFPLLKGKAIKWEAR